MGKLIIDGNSVYEIDEECLKNRRVPENCHVKQVLQRTEEGKHKTSERKNGGAG